jgi:hypothetical protein
MTFNWGMAQPTENRTHVLRANSSSLYNFTTGTHFMELVKIKLIFGNKVEREAGTARVGSTE